MPQEWTVEQIKQAYYDAWKMMTKAVALYRDGCKLSQPLNTTLEDNAELKSILSGGEVDDTVTKKVMVGPKELTLHGKKSESGKLEEVSVGIEHLNPVQEAMTTALVNSVNLSLKSGLSASVIAQSSLQVEGHPIISELYKFMQEFSGTPVSSVSEVPSSIEGSSFTEPEIVTVGSSVGSGLADDSDKQKCTGCGATQLRQNGTCMLCEVCGETSGCS